MTGRQHVHKTADCTACAGLGELAGGEYRCSRCAGTGVEPLPEDDAVRLPEFFERYVSSVIRAENEAIEDYDEAWRP